MYTKSTQSKSYISHSVKNVMYHTHTHESPYNSGEHINIYVTIDKIS